MKCTHRPGHFIVTVADEISVIWLRETAPSLKLWKYAILRTLEGNEIPNLHVCTTYVPDEADVRLDNERILTRPMVGITRKS